MSTVTNNNKEYRNLFYKNVLFLAIYYKIHFVYGGRYVIGQKQYQDVSLNYNYKWGHLYYTYNFATSSLGKTSEHDFMT